MEIKKNTRNEIVFYSSLLSEIKNRIRQAQVKASFSANAEMIAMYWDIVRMIHERQQQEGWSAAVIPKLSRDIKNELPEIKGFSERNIGRMLAFFHTYPKVETFLPQLVAKIKSAPENLKSSLPSIEEIEAELSGTYIEERDNE